VVIRPLQGEVPTIDLVMGYSRSNTSLLLKRFLSRADESFAASDTLTSARLTPSGSENGSTVSPNRFSSA
jgi:LysR family transcriptional regulator, hca operon transcriptional activator